MAKGKDSGADTSTAEAAGGGGRDWSQTLNLPQTDFPMRAGLPVLASDVPGTGIGHVVEDGASGLLVPPGDPAALAAAMERLAEPALRTRLGAAARARWSALFTLEREVERVRAIYRDCIA